MLDALSDFWHFYKYGIYFAAVSCTVGSFCWEVFTFLTKKYVTKRPYK